MNNTNATQQRNIKRSWQNNTIMNNMITVSGNKKTSEIIHQPKSKTRLPKKIGFSFLANASPKREPISNVSNLREDSCHRD